MKLVFATNNPHKLKEIRQIIGDQFEILSLEDIGFVGEIPEDQPTIEGNASQKARYIYDRYQINCFADDTGLEIDALDGEPGVHTARYAGEQRNSQDNIDKVLQKLVGQDDRKAHFKTVISLIIDGQEHLFTGIVNGTITKERKGKSDFGYDPTFLPDGYDQTFAEMPDGEKNLISHRGCSVQKLIKFLKGNYK